MQSRPQSHPARGAWIEILMIWYSISCAGSHPARGAWIEIQHTTAGFTKWSRSHPARGAWIEITDKTKLDGVEDVAPHTGCVD